MSILDMALRLGSAAVPAVSGYYAGKAKVKASEDERQAELEKEQRAFDRQVLLNGLNRKWQLKDTDDGTVQIDPDTGEVRPLKGPDGNPLRPPAKQDPSAFIEVGGRKFPNTPDGQKQAIAWQQSLHPQEPKEPKDAKERWQVIDTPQGRARLNLDTGEVRPVMDNGGKQVRKPDAVGVIKKVATNNRTLSAIDEAIAAIEQHPNALGLKNYLPDAIRQRTDEKGIGTRAAVQDVGSLEMHDRYGSRLTLAETKYGAPFVPRPTDTKEAALVKLKRLRGLVQDETNELNHSAQGDDGGEASNAPSQPLRPNGKPYRANNPAVNR